jgi:hypothetical protein
MNNLGQRIKLGITIISSGFLLAGCANQENHSLAWQNATASDGEPQGEVQYEAWLDKTNKETIAHNKIIDDEKTSEQLDKEITANLVSNIAFENSSLDDCPDNFGRGVNHPVEKTELEIQKCVDEEAHPILNSSLMDLYKEILG